MDLDRKIDLPRQTFVAALMMPAWTLEDQILSRVVLHLKPNSKIDFQMRIVGMKPICPKP
jgi:hypothetical protein